MDNLRKLFAASAKIRIRIPVIPDVNDSIAEMQKIRNFLAACGKPEKIELLPYHAMGENKYQAIGAQAQIFQVPSAEKMQQLNELFKNIQTAE